MSDNTVHQFLGSLGNAHSAQVATDGQRRDAMHQRPERPGHLAGILSRDDPGLLAPGDRVEQVPERLLSGHRKALLGLQRRPKHHLIVIGMGDGPPHVGAAELGHPCLRIRHAIGCRGQLGVQVKESLFGDGGQQLGLVGEVPVRRRGTDPGAARRLREGEPFRPLLGHQRQRRAGERALEITVVIALPPAHARPLHSHVDDINIKVYVNDIHIGDQGDDMTNLLDTTSTLAGTRDRERTADLLGQALAQGYLQIDEYDRRLQAAFQTQTDHDLRELLADLPVDRIRRHDPRRRAARVAAARRGVRAHLAAYLAMVVVVLTVWAAVALTTDATYFWPIWPILGAGIGLVSHAVSIPRLKQSRWQPALSAVLAPGLCANRNHIR